MRVEGEATKKEATLLSYLTQDSDVVASSTCSSVMDSIVAATREESTAVKRQISDTHDEQSQNTDEETVDTPFTEPHTSLIDSGITKNVPDKAAQDTQENWCTATKE
ncbi:hypothetical protein HHI36_013385 [Cryptolaemus montrouzieri]|uniref:Uncharacterized protein n=1 Tax=Cryptolaemus montrouzieri TaxID=559131 RepID=A0ABD2NHR1_9CUCU